MLLPDPVSLSTLHFKISLVNLVPLHFHVNFRINLSISIEKPAKILIGNAMNLETNLRSNIMTKLSLTIHEYDISPIKF